MCPYPFQRSYKHSGVVIYCIEQNHDLALLANSCGWKWPNATIEVWKHLSSDNDMKIMADLRNKGIDAYTLPESRKKAAGIRLHMPIYPNFINLLAQGTPCVDCP